MTWWSCGGRMTWWSHFYHTRSHRILLRHTVLQPIITHHVIPYYVLVLSSGFPAPIMGSALSLITM